MQDSGASQRSYEVGKQVGSKPVMLAGYAVIATHMMNVYDPGVVGLCQSESSL
ncbi:MAG TPA: hypothetical protein GX506_01685 [Firmicutes bacterium]|nr:hypothetical protein [Bacillota bacterium]